MDFLSVQIYSTRLLGLPGMMRRASIVETNCQRNDNSSNIKLLDEIISASEVF